ncbi:hypothetical protein XA68_11341 [Ophiocordyceps unilateralis]|uniref:Uncharacterized protein n=1 Tax=Ophiocordyceps unilateralis TaxID=268505 RepID=A0A2A9PH22_OPHUN|nr:hypothetical protein XA68_11341 [Ophiocordyceps unilateralis]
MTKESKIFILLQTRLPCTIRHLPALIHLLPPGHMSIDIDKSMIEKGIKRHPRISYRDSIHCSFHTQPITPTPRKDMRISREDATGTAELIN